MTQSSKGALTSYHNSPVSPQISANGPVQPSDVCATLTPGNSGKVCSDMTMLFVLHLLTLPRFGQQPRKVVPLSRRQPGEGLETVREAFFPHSRQAVEQQADAGEVDERLTTGRKPLIVAAQASGAAQPSEGALDDPPPGQDMKARLKAHIV
jgi:hypothetical protein